MPDLAKSLARVEEFATLPAGWDYGRGCPSSVSTCTRAQTILTLLHDLGLRRFDVAPGSNGGVTVAAIHSIGNEIEIHCNTTATYDLFVCSDGDELIDREKLAYVTLNAELGGVPWLSKKSSTWFTPNVTLVTWGDSQVNPLRTHPTGLEYPLFACAALSNEAEASVRTFKSTRAQASAGIRRFSGGSNTRKLQTA